MPPFEELLLVAILLLLAVASLFDRHLVRACTWFVIFGLTVALAWARLGLIWLAWLELVLGAILTGACLFYALGVMPGVRKPRGFFAHWHDPVPLTWRLALERLLPALAVLAMLGAALVALDDSGSGSLRPGGLGLLVLGLWAFALHRHLLRRLLAFNIIGTGIFLLLMSLAGAEALPAAHGLVITGLVVALVGTALGALLVRRIEALESGQGVASRSDGRS
ncbi:NADH-quinone oxidoreductase subunit K [Halomonas sp. LR3S48]|uniref:NADH-quinone oxidoreductase subunit K n=1 Tax=Halomonas sp. LR3S48 TaxID=2982694 RepID=UPI0021E477C9|nr:NADH-quinone oxidoreductase subunit K [Halomonas sp. LR3S48]UYG04915.1 NADH-quinone oxidoreductase subunit K [Halomonas sp. LR3S48]